MTRPDAFAALVHDFVRSVRLQPPFDGAQGDTFQPGQVA
jgi:hypothetical protein